MKWNILVGVWLSFLAVIWLVHPILHQPWNTIGIIVMSVFAILNWVAAGIQFMIGELI